MRGSSGAQLLLRVAPCSYRLERGVVFLSLSVMVSPDSQLQVEDADEEYCAFSAGQGGSCLASGNSL